MDNNPDIVNKVGNLLPFPLKFPDESRVIFSKTVDRMKSLIQCVMGYHKMGFAASNINLENIGSKNNFFGDPIPLVLTDLSGMLQIGRADRIKGVSPGSAPELMKHVSLSDMGVFYADLEPIVITEKADVFSLGVLMMRMLMADVGVMSQSYHQGGCKDRKCFKQYIKDIKNMRVTSNEEFPPVIKLREYYTNRPKKKTPEQIQEE